ncbi:MAG: TrkH family potassium uptake protein [Fluviicola sp.]
MDVPLLDSLFIASSAVSTTGLVTVSVFDSYNFGGQFVVMCLFQIGGIGYMTLTTYFLLRTTNSISRWHSKIIGTEFTMPKTIEIKDFLKSVIVFTLVMEALGAISFFIAFKQEGMATLEAVWSSIFHSVSAFCTAGFSLNNDSFIHFQNNGHINATISILAIAGSLGFIVVTDIWNRITRKSDSLSFTTKLIFYSFIILLTLGTVLIYFTEPATEFDGEKSLLTSFFQTMTAMTTVGFNTVDTGALSKPIIMFIIFLMYLGASPSGTAGGMKITTLIAMLSVIWSRITGRKKITFMNRSIPFERLYVATSTFILYTSIVFFMTFILCFSESHSLENILFEVASALGTVGLSTGITGDLSVFGKIAITVIMFIGRVGVLTFGFALLARKSKEEPEIIEDDLAV